MDGPRNMTGLYLGGFIQEGYLPPRERKSTIPSTLYRGHVVKLARAPNSNPHRSSVGRYPMHSLNAGFAGTQFPIKDQMNFKSPRDLQRYKKYKARGKWANYPMTIEIRKIAGTGTSGSYLAECVLGEKNIIKQDVMKNEPYFSYHAPNPTSANLYGEMNSASPACRDREEERFYQVMYDEIHQVVSGQQNSMLHNQHKLQRILLNPSDIGIRPDVVTPAHQKRVATSYGFGSRFTPATPTRRPHTTTAAPEKEYKSLLLPVPFVSSHRLATPQLQPSKPAVTPDSMRVDLVSPWRSNLRSLTPYLQRAKAEKYYRDDGVRWNSPEPVTSISTQGNLGESSAERVSRLLSAAAEDNFKLNSGTREPVSHPSRKKDGFTQDEIHDFEAGILQRKLRSTPSTGTKLSWKIDSPSQTQHSSLSVVVPASYEEPPSLPSTPLPPTIVEPALDQSAEIVLTPEPPHVTDMGSGAAKLFRCDLQTKDVTSICDDASMTKAADTEIQCVVELCDGKKIPADIDFGPTITTTQETTDKISCNFQAEAEAKRLELKTLLLEYKQLVNEVQRLELYKRNNAA